MKKTVLGSVMALTACAFAEGDVVAAQTQNNGRSQQQMSGQPTPSIVTLTSARPESDNGWYLFSDVLYWHASIGNTDWAHRNNEITASVIGPTHSLNFKWDWGFRVGLGVNMDHDMWDSNLYYTWFHTENSNSVGSSLDQATIFFEPGAAVSSAEIHWSVHYSMFDWELGRWYYVSKGLALRPHVGVKGGWINQNIHQHARDNAEDFAYRIHFENEFWGVGPCGGINTMWVLGNVNTHRFSFLGDFAGALLYGHFEVEAKQTRTDTTTGDIVIIQPKDLNRNLAVPMLQAMLGLSWDTSFNRDRCHFTMDAGYEFQYWFRQNQLPFITRSGAAGIQNFRLSDDLALQGVTGRLRFDF